MIDVKRLEAPGSPGRRCGIEMPNVYVSPRDLRNVLLDIAGVANVRVRPLYGRWNDVRVRFQYCEREWLVLEPFGDSSRYWIVPAEEAPNAEQIDVLHQAFAQFQPRLFRRVLGDLLTLRFLRRRPSDGLKP